MQCKCGADAKSEISTFTTRQEKECLEFSNGRKPDGYPVNVRRSVCGCGRISVNFSYMCAGVTLKEGEILKPDGTIVDRDGKFVRGLQQPVNTTKKVVTSTAKRLW